MAKKFFDEVKSSTLWKIEVFLAVLLIVIPCVMIGVYNSRPWIAELSAVIIANLMCFVWITVRFLYASCENKMYMCMANTNDFVQMSRDFVGQYNKGGDFDAKAARTVQSNCELVGAMMKSRHANEKTGKGKMEMTMSRWGNIASTVFLSEVATTGSYAQIVEKDANDSMSIVCPSQVNISQIVILCVSCILSTFVVVMTVALISEKRRKEIKKKLSKTAPMIALLLMLCGISAIPIGNELGCTGVRMEKDAYLCIMDYETGERYCRH